MGAKSIPETDKEAWEIHQRTKSYKKGGIEMGVPESTFTYRVMRHRKRIATDAQAADGFKVKGTSTLFNSKNEVVAQWVKTSIDAERQFEMMQAAIAALKEQVVPIGPVAAPAHNNLDLLALYVLSDYHLGVFAHADEGGADWSFEIAQDGLYKWARMAVDLAPPAHTAVFLQNGDFLHFDGLSAVTPKSRHVLDADARFTKLVRASIKAIRYAVSLMLEKHQHVHIIMSDGNHDESGSAWLRELLAVLYENEPRVTVDQTEHPYYCFEWGKTSIFAHHGDKRNINNVSEVVTALYHQQFGRTKHRYCHLGHVHHSASKDNGLMHVIVHPTLAARDAYAARYGYLAQRKARTFLYHKEYGEVGMIAITPEMLK